MSKPPLPLPGHKKIPPPESLGEAGKAVWSKFQEDYYGWNTKELELLEAYAETVDRLARWKAKVDEDGDVITNPRTLMLMPHPLLSQITNGQSLARQLLKQLIAEIDPPTKRRPGRPEGTMNRERW